MPVQPLASVTVTVIGKSRSASACRRGRRAAESVRPAGSVPLVSVNVAVADAAPVCVKVWLNGALDRAGGRRRVGDGDGLAADGQRVGRAGAGAAVRVGGVTVIGNEPVCVGVPERTPVELRA